MATLAELLTPPAPDFCTHCAGFGFVKEQPDGTKADFGHLMCHGCGGKQRRSPEDVLAYNEAWTRERKHVK